MMLWSLSVSLLNPARWWVYVPTPWAPCPSKEREAEK